MDRLVRFFVDRYVFSLAIFLAIVFFGLTTALRLGVDLLPEFEFPIVAVNTTYAGAGSQETAEQLSEPIEDALTTIPGISDITSFSGEGFSFVIAQFNYGTDVDQAAIDVKQRLDAITDGLPDDASTPTVQKFDPADEPILNIAVTAPGVDLVAVQRVAEDELEAPLQQVEGVADVAVVGPVEREVQVLMLPEELRSYGLTPAQVAGAIRASSLTVPAGALTLGSERILLSVRTSPESAADVAEMVVDPVRGVRVADIATVRDTPAEASTFTRLNGEPAVILEVRKVSGANSVATGQRLKAALARLDLPNGYQTTVVGDTTVFVANSVFDTLRETLLAGLAVAFIVLLFVGRLGSTFSVVIAIPITITGAIIIFGLLGFTFNVVTLLAVTVAVGLVVDDSIVIAENIERHRVMGYGLKEAVFVGAGEVSVAVLTATLSLLAVFLPIAFLPGVIGQFFSQFGLSLAATIFVSYLEAMFFLTVRLAYMPNPLPPTWSESASVLGSYRRRIGRAVGAWTALRLWLAALVLAAAAGALVWVWPAGLTEALASAGVDPSTWWLASWRADMGAPVTALVVACAAAAAVLAVPAVYQLLGWLLMGILSLVGAVFRTLHEATDALVARTRGAYGRVLDRLLDHSTLVLAVAAVLVGSLFVIFPRIQFNFVSQVDAGQVAVRLELPPGTPLSRTDEVSAQVERELRDVPEARAILASVGSGGLLSNSNAQVSDVVLELDSLGERRRSSFAIAEDLRPRLERLVGSAYPEATLTVSSDDGGAVPVETGVEVTLTSTDRALLEERDQLARQVMRDNPHLQNVSSSLEGSVSERVFILDDTALAGTGLTPSDVAQTLRAFNVGIRAGNVRERGAEIPISVRIDPVYIADEQALLSLPIRAPALQGYLPLGVLGRFELQAAPVSIDRSNQAYVATLRGDLTAGAPGQFEVRRAVEEAFAAAGVIDGDVQVGTGVGPDLLGDLVFYGPIAFALALLLNYLVIASQFNSFRYPLYLLLTVPLALVGAFWLFYLTGQALDVISVLGVVILIGLVTKNAILLLDAVVSQFEEGETLKGALVRAGELRLRPILMTALTVVIISLPLLLGLGEGSEFRRPLGYVILGGVISSTFLTLFVVPAAFYRFERRRYEGPGGTAAKPRAASATPEPAVTASRSAASSDLPA